MKWRVNKEEYGERLQDFLHKKYTEVSSNRELKRIIESGSCLVNGVVERFASKKLKTGDHVQFEPTHLKSGQFRFEAHAILFEDEEILAYNKPAGVASDAAGILKLLLPHGNYLLTHRLDKDTSGVLLLAKTARAEARLIDDFRKRNIRKEYLAIVDGCPKELLGTIETYIGKIGSFHGQTLYGNVQKEKGKHAKTSWLLRKVAKTASMLACYPETGRTHQIRVHLNGMKHPILGDYQYGKTFRCKIRPPRMLLHASKIQFSHPVTEKNMEIEAPLPEDFLKFMRAIW